MRSLIRAIFVSAPQQECCAATCRSLISRTLGSCEPRGVSTRPCVEGFFDRGMDLQGLEVSSSGRALARPHRLELEQWVEEQIGWAASAEKPSAQYLEAFAFRRGKAMEGAGELPSRKLDCMPSLRLHASSARPELSTTVGLVALHQHSLHLRPATGWHSSCACVCMMCNESALSQRVYPFSGVHLAEAACKAGDCASAVLHGIHSAQ